MRETARSSLSDEERAEFDELVADRAFDDDTFEEYLEQIEDEHINRSDEEPFEFSPATNPDVYGVMWGPNEFVLADTARLRDWSVTDRLSEIHCPTLVINGEYDEIAPELGEAMAEEIPDARFIEIEDASHVPLWEARETHDYRRRVPGLCPVNHITTGFVAMPNTRPTFSSRRSVSGRIATPR
jgi:proline-specific peptidase